MILNDVLKRRQKCLLECEQKQELCEYKSPHDHDCEEKRDACGNDCEFDHSPN